MKAKRKQEFSANLKTLTGTLETRSESGKQALKKDSLTLSHVTMIGTRKNRLNTEIELHNGNSKKLNVVGGTLLECLREYEIRALQRKYAAII